MTIHFLSLLLCSFFHFFFSISDAPVFAGNLTNASLLTEIATGSNRNLTCTVVGYQGPSALSLNVTMEPNATPNWKYHRNNASSITVPITNASQSDVAAYVCHACCGQETKYCSYLEFDTYVGGEKRALYMHWLMSKFSLYSWFLLAHLQSSIQYTCIVSLLLAKALLISNAVLKAKHST